MRTRLPFLLLLSSPALAQTPVERADQRTDDVFYSAIAPMGDSLWAVTGWANPEGGFWQQGGFFVSALDGDGQTMWNQPLDFIPHGYSGYPTGLDVIDGTLLIAGWVGGCDVLMTTSTVMRMDAQGATMWSRTFDFFPEYTFLQHACAGPDTLLAVATENRVLIMTVDGDSITSWLSAIQPIRSLAWADSGSLLIASDTLLGRYTIDGTAIGNAVMTTGGLDVLVLDEHVLSLGDTSYTVFDADLANANVFDLAALADGSPRQFIRSAGAVAVLTTNELVHLDVDLAPANVVELAPLPGHAVVAGIIRDDLLITAGQSTQHNRHAGVFRTYLADGSSTTFQDDVELLVQVDSAWFHLSGMSGPDSIFIQYANATVRVVNHGDQPLDKVLLNYRPAFGVGYCGPGGISLLADSLGLAPSDTAAFQMDMLWINMGPSEPGSTVTSEVCIVAESPNDHVDRDPVDNYSCESVTYTNTVGISEQAQMALRVFPNPFNGSFTIDLNGVHGVVYLTLSDASGRCVMSEVHAGGSAVELSCGNIPAGTYALSITNEAGMRRTVRVVSL